MTYDFKKQEAELDELLEMIKGVKKLIQMRMESPAKEEPKPVESHFDSFPGHFISSEMQEWKKSYRGVQEERQKIGSSFGANVAGNGPLEKYKDEDNGHEEPRKLHLKYGQYCPGCGHDLTEEFYEES